MNSSEAGQAGTAAPHAHPASWFPPSFGSCMPWILRKVHQHKLSAGGRGFPGLPTGSCSLPVKMHKTSQDWRLQRDFTFYLTWKAVLLKAERTASAGASQKCPESPPPTDTWPMKGSASIQVLPYKHQQHLGKGTRKFLLSRSLLPHSQGLPQRSVNAG